jgi:hypothetical protein
MRPKFAPSTLKKVSWSFRIAWNVMLMEKRMNNDGSARLNGEKKPGFRAASPNGIEVWHGETRFLSTL